MYNSILQSLFCDLSVFWIFTVIAAYMICIKRWKSYFSNKKKKQLNAAFQQYCIIITERAEIATVCWSLADAFESKSFRKRLLPLFAIPQGIRKKEYSSANLRVYIDVLSKSREKWYLIFAIIGHNIIVGRNIDWLEGKFFNLSFWNKGKLIKVTKVIIFT
jgi:hypothetical protein